MRAFRYFSYFSQLRKIIGLKAAAAFAVAHLCNKSNPPHDGKLASVPVGPYTLYFPYLPHFVGLFTEIFFKETYYLPATQEKIQTIDCGANIGVALLYIKIRAPHARVLCFEPNPAARAVLEKNIAVNKWGDDVKVYSCALGKKKGSTQFYVMDTVATSSDGSVADYLKDKGRSLNSYPVEVDTLSSYINAAVDFIKIDIEGPELDVLHDMQSAHKLKQVRAIQLEYHYIPGHFESPLSETLVLLESEGFHTFVHANSLAHNVIGNNILHTYMVFAWRK